MQNDNTITMKEFMAWLYCPGRLFFENTFSDYDDADLSEIILDLQGRAAAGDLSSKQIDELRVMELLLEERVHDPEKKAENILLETSYSRLVRPVVPLLIKALAVSFLISFLFFYLLG
jgi:hypothetical protein